MKSRRPQSNALQVKDLDITKLYEAFTAVCISNQKGKQN